MSSKGKIMTLKNLAILLAVSLAIPAQGSFVIPDAGVNASKLASSAVGSSVNYSVSTSVGASALTISLKTQSGAAPSAASPIKIPFTAATSAGAAQQSVGSVTSALSITISSAATLGCKSALPCRIYLYALLNSGTVELAVSQSQSFDEGIALSTTLMSGTSTSAQIMYSTTARASVFVKRLAVITATEATAGTWATLPSTIGYTTPEYVGRSYITLDTFTTGYGSSSTKVPKFTNATVVGTAISASANSSTLGHIITINEPGIYCANMYFRGTVNTEDFFGITVNANGATALQSLSVGSVLCKVIHPAIAATSGPESCSWCGWLDNSDQILLHTHTGSTPATAADCKINVVKMMSQ